MKLTPELIEHIKDLEGLELEAYYDENNVLTIGYGHTNATGTFEFKEGDKITSEQALDILQKDLNEAEGFVERMLANRDLSVDDVKKNYMTLVYFNRPWALRETMEVIAEGNTDLVVKSQLDSYKKNRSEEIPDWFKNRINKEIAFVNEFDDPTESGGNATDTKEPITIYLGDKPQLVDPNIADAIVKNTDYTYEPTTQSKVEDLVEAKPETPVSVEEGQREKEVKDVLTAHIYSYLQKQKNVYESQVPKEAGPIDVARVKTDIRRAERE